MSRPVVELYNHQEAVALDLGSLGIQAELVLPMVLLCPVPPGAVSVLGDLDTVEVSFINDAEIARVHGEFLDDPTPTDVITFDHGEILISAETAARCAADYGHTPPEEALLYLIHGLLHLRGYDDQEPESRAAMHRTQQHLLEKIRKQTE